MWADTSQANTKKDKLNLILENINKRNIYNKDQMRAIKAELSRKFMCYYQTWWRESRVSRKREKFIHFHKQWLDSEFIIDFGTNNLENDEDNQNLELNDDDESLHGQDRETQVNQNFTRNSNANFEEMQVDDCHLSNHQNFELGEVEDNVRSVGKLTVPKKGCLQRLPKNM